MCGGEIHGGRSWMQRLSERNVVVSKAWRRQSRKEATGLKTWVQVSTQFCSAAPPSNVPEAHRSCVLPIAQGPACNNCLPNHYPTTAGACSACGSFDWLPFYAVLVCTWALVSLLITRVNAELSNSNLNKLTIAAVANQLCFVIQTFSTIRQLHIRWPEPVKSLVDIANLITMIDLDFLKISCVSQYDHPAIKLTGQLLAFPALAFGVSSIWVLHRVLRRTEIPYDHVFNILGLVLLPNANMAVFSLLH